MLTKQQKEDVFAFLDVIIEIMDKDHVQKGIDSYRYLKDYGGMSTGQYTVIRNTAKFNNIEIPNCFTHSNVVEGNPRYAPGQIKIPLKAQVQLDKPNHTARTEINDLVEIIQDNQREQKVQMRKSKPNSNEIRQSINALVDEVFNSKTLLETILARLNTLENAMFIDD